MTELVLEIPRAPASPNEFLGFHWRHRKRNSDLWQKEIRVALAAQQYFGIQKPLNRAHVAIERRSRGQMDPDNLYGAVKPVIDALRYAGILLDDSPDHLELAVTQVRSFKDPPRTRIVIQPLESA